MAKMTYAQIAEKLSKEYNKYDKNLQNAVTDAEKNSAMMMLQRVSDRLNQLMLANQAEANAADQKETPPDSPNQSIGQRTMRMAKNGGSLKSIPKGKKGKGLSKLPKKVRNKMGYMQAGGDTDPAPTYVYAEGLTPESIYPGPITLDDIYGSEVFPGATEVNPTVANFLNFINTGHSAYLPPEGSRHGSRGKHQAMRKFYLQSGRLKDDVALRSGEAPVPAFPYGKGGSVSWNWGGKKYSGTLIPSMETSEARFARTHNGKVKRLPKKEKGGSLKEIPANNTGLPKLPEFVRNRMGYMKNGGRLYDGITMEQIKEYLEEAGILSGLGDKFDPKNPEHVKKLQEGLLGAYTGPGANTMLSGKELEFIGPDGPQSVNQAGVDGKFGIDTLTALQQFSEAKNPFANMKPLELEPLELPALPTFADLDPLKPREYVKTKDGGDEEPSVKNFLQNNAMKLLPGIAKYLEYDATANALNSMLPPPDLTLQRPRYINTDVDISSELAALNDAQLMRERTLTDSSTKRNNVLQNLNASDAKFNRLRNELYGKKRNEERKLENLQSMLGFQTDDENRKRIYDNAMNYRDFLNDQTRARRDFRSAVVGDVMDLQTQRTDRESQMARLNALMPYLNMYGVYDRTYAGANPTLLNLLGFNKS